MIVQTGKVVLEVTKDIEYQSEKKQLMYQFVMPMGSPYGIAYDVAHEMLTEILRMADEAAKRTERNQEGDKAIEPN